MLFDTVGNSCRGLHKQLRTTSVPTGKKSVTAVIIAELGIAILRKGSAAHGQQLTLSNWKTIFVIHPFKSTKFNVDCEIVSLTAVTTLADPWSVFDQSQIRLSRKIKIGSGTKPTFLLKMKQINKFTKNHHTYVNKRLMHFF